jgi:hypothetical protein
LAWHKDNEALSSYVLAAELTKKHGANENEEIKLNIIRKCQLLAKALNKEFELPEWIKSI